ncbi:hypothetical protein D3C78_1543120 [compost metagenome]
MFGLGGGDALQQFAALAAPAVVLDPRRQQLDAVLFSLRAALLLFGQRLFQRGRLGRFAHLGQVRGQLLAALVQAHLALGNGIAGVLQALAQRREVGGRAGQQGG